MSGPDPAVAAVRAALRKDLGDLLPGQLVLVACSGGADSVALAVATAFVAARLELRAGLVTVDHRLQDGSAEQAERVRCLGETLGLDPVIVTSVRVVPKADGPEAAAREARHGALQQAAQAYGASAVLLAHHRDDQAEQVLLGLARGSGARSLAGIPPRRGLLRRPLLELPRSVLNRAAQGYEVWEDPTNTDLSLTRARVRSEVLPLLEKELGPGVASALARTARLCRDDAELLDELALKAGETCQRKEGLDVAALTALPRAVRTRVLRRYFSGASAVQVDAVDALITDWRGQGEVALSGGRAARRTAGLVTLVMP